MNVGIRQDRVAGVLSSIAATILLSIAIPASAQTPAQVRGSYGGTAPFDGYRIEGSFSCSGSPTCVGQYTDTWFDPSCANGLVASDELIINGLNLGSSGSLQGTMTFRNWNFEYNIPTNGSCTVVPGTLSDVTVPYTGTWNATTRTATLSIGFIEGWLVPGTLTADITTPTPVFPMSVNARIDAAVANASATLQFRAEDLGRQGNVYVFAVAPVSQVKAGDVSKATYVGEAWDNGKADPPPGCVFAQLNASGQLQAATPEQLQAALSGILTSAGASVPIMTNVSTPNVASATFYVGYGSSATAMINDGIYRSAVTVPGPNVCPMPSSQTALWWNPAESGWGINLNHQGNIIFATLFTYDSAGAPLWLVMSSGAMQSDGKTFTGTLYRTTGPAFNANPFTPIGPGNLATVGTMTVSFIDASGGTLRYTVNGVEVNKAIQRQVYGTRAASCFPTTASRVSSTNYQDLWWNAAESGWGINVTHQDNTLFATLFTYDATGKGLWLVMSDGRRQADGSYSGTLFRTSGPAFNATPFTPIGPGNIANVGTMSFRFSNGESGTLNYTYSGTPVTKQITRQVFSNTVPLCN